MKEIMGTCSWLAKVQAKGRPVVVLGGRDAHLYQDGALVPFGVPPVAGYEGYRERIRLIGDALRSRGLGGDYVAFWPVENKWGVASQVTLQYVKEMFLRGAKLPRGECEKL